MWRFNGVLDVVQKHFGVYRMSWDAFTCIKTLDCLCGIQMHQQEYKQRRGIETIKNKFGISATRVYG